MSRTFVVLAVTTFLATAVAGCRLFSDPAAAADRDTGEIDTSTDAHTDIDAMPPESPTPR